ncbi:hypothetical protein ASE17_07115 [Phenylobacterium sp. Root77]|jgi:hypothetical protein|uniref:hypothetical protein n=1 Tax=unclassified Phenylobacterium TaxID=2640670 RepID=UPI0006FD5F3D|nr:MULTISPECIES: hypothetical protein [unclassified Phenylobacterium]KQW68219.1 hypothetical protein ASC73_17020 [Phenylobacterium sp. Root1277]KQW91960.1 hypothetical protein ASC79_10395 [Phenylobacterium sp. Root1290]KRC40192.1 hypothetical protein ASE17_07115 [Phenylobacterium sp. Root77]
MLKYAILLTITVGLASPAAAAPSWRVQQACAMQRYLRATPAFPTANWGRDATSVSTSGARTTLARREDAAARAQFDSAMRSGRAFADRAVDQLAAQDRITQEEAFRRIGGDPGPWPQVTPAKCEALERRAQRAER